MRRNFHSTIDGRRVIYVILKLTYIIVMTTYKTLINVYFSMLLGENTMAKNSLKLCKF